MNLVTLKFLAEASYAGNIGMMEMFKFYQVATPEQKKKMQELLAGGKQEDAWNFMQEVTKTTLH